MGPCWFGAYLRPEFSWGCEHAQDLVLPTAALLLVHARWNGGDERGLRDRLVHSQLRLRGRLSL
jgi:hypothetical protein